MPLSLNDPNVWRERAEETRVLAETFTDSFARQNMFKVAAAYERMAERAEKYPIERSLMTKSMEVARSILIAAERLREIAASKDNLELTREMRRVAGEMVEHAADIERTQEKFAASRRFKQSRT